MHIQGWEYIWNDLFCVYSLKLERKSKSSVGSFPIIINIVLRYKIIFLRFFTRRLSGTFLPIVKARYITYTICWDSKWPICCVGVPKVFLEWPPSPLWNQHVNGCSDLRDAYTVTTCPWLEDYKRVGDVRKWTLIQRLFFCQHDVLNDRSCCWSLFSLPRLFCSAFL